MGTKSERGNSVGGKHRQLRILYPVKNKNLEKKKREKEFIANRSALKKY